MTSLLVWAISALALSAPSASKGLIEQARREAERGNYEQAVSAFTEADRLEPRFSHHCNIAGVYALWARKESTRTVFSLRWVQSWAFLSSCEQRAMEQGATAPPWLRAEMDRQAKALRAAGFAEVVFESHEPTTLLFPSLSLVEEWKVVTSRTFWLPVGLMRVLENPTGSRLEHRLSLVSGRQVVNLTAFRPPPAPAQAEVPPPEAPAEMAPAVVVANSPAPLVQPQPEPHAAPSLVGPIVLLGGSVVSGALSGTFAGLALQTHRELLTLPQVLTQTQFDEQASPQLRSYATERFATYTLMSVGVALAVGGAVWLLIRVLSDP